MAYMPATYPCPSQKKPSLSRPTTFVQRTSSSSIHIAASLKHFSRKCSVFDGNTFSGATPSGEAQSSRHLLTARCSNTLTKEWAPNNTSPDPVMSRYALKTSWQMSRNTQEGPVRSMTSRHHIWQTVDEMTTAYTPFQLQRCLRKGPTPDPHHDWPSLPCLSSKKSVSGPAAASYASRYCSASQPLWFLCQDVLNIGQRSYPLWLHRQHALPSTEVQRPQ